MCKYVNHAIEITALKKIVKDHNKMLLEASMNKVITDNVRNIVTGYHRTRKQAAEDRIKKLQEVPNRVKKCVHSKNLTVGTIHDH